MSEKVRLIDDPILREVCEPINELDRLFIIGLLETMNETMIASHGIGLAANQIGYPIRVFILKKDDSYREYINPEVTTHDELVTFETEACLSIPGTYGATKRYRKVSLSWLDRDGIKHEGSFEDVEAFAIQHEMDHLNGMLYIDRLSPLLRKMTLKKHHKFLRGY